jgi:phage terminase Nu1 subunit (DNA packaging protein)
MPETKPPQPGVSAQVLAKLWCMESPRHVQLLAEKGIAVRIARGRYDATASTQNYIKHLREQAAGRVGNDPSSDGVAAGARHKDAATRLLDLKFQEKAGQLLPADLVIDVWTRIGRAARQAFMSFPNRVATIVPTLSAFDRAQIEKLVRDTLEGLALGRGMDFVKSKHGVDSSGPAGGHNGAKVVAAAADPENVEARARADRSARGDDGTDRGVPALAATA